MHKIIKHETIGMNDVQLENLANKERKILIDRINEQSLNEDLANYLLLQNGHSSTLSRNSIQSNDYLLKESWEIWGHWKRKEEKDTRNSTCPK